MTTTQRSLMFKAARRLEEVALDFEGSIDANDKHLIAALREAVKKDAARANRLLAPHPAASTKE